MLLIAAIVIFISFIYFSFLVSKETFLQIDFDTTVKLQDRISTKWDLLFSTLSAIGSAEITGLIWLAIITLSLLKRFWLTAVSQLLFVLAGFIEIFGKLFVYHPGPPFMFFRGVLETGFPSHYIHTDYSYPSGHMTRTSFIIAFIILWLYFRYPKLKSFIPQVALIVFFVLMLISRISLGEHWLSDVVGGVLLGASFGILSALTIPTSKVAKEKQTEV